MNTDPLTYILRFATTSSADATYYAEELGEALLDTSPDIKVERRRENPTTQDFGSTLVVVLGAPAVVTVANAIGNWLLRRTSASLTIETPDKKILVQNITSQDAAHLAQLLVAQGKQENK